MNIKRINFKGSNTKKYIVAFVTLILVIIVNQLFIQYWLYKKHNDAQLINIAGRQRMLSQKINLIFYQIERGNKIKVDSLIQIIDEWSIAQTALLYGSKSMNIDPPDNPEIIKKLEEAKAHIQWLKDNLSSVSTAEVDKNQSRFLLKMECIVKNLEEDATKKLNLVIWTEISLAIISLLIISLELKFIFIPIQKSLIYEKNRYEKLFHELNHRVKNSLFMISSLLNIRKLKSKEKSTRAMYQETQNTLNSVYSAYKLLLEGNDEREIRIDNYIHDIVDQFKLSYLVNPKKFDFELQLLPIMVPMDFAQIIGIVINEIMSNSIKYAYDQEKGGKIDIQLCQQRNQLKLDVRDFGNSMKIDEKNESFGSQIIQGLVQNIDGKLTLSTEGGYHYTVYIPLRNL